MSAIAYWWYCNTHNNSIFQKQSEQMPLVCLVRHTTDVSTWIREGCFQKLSMQSAQLSDKDVNSWDTHNIREEALLLGP